MAKTILKTSTIKPIEYENQIMRRKKTILVFTIFVRLRLTQLVALHYDFHGINVAYELHICIYIF